jgi:hypothetical protein
MPGGGPRVVEASFLVTFLGGLLSLLSPCSALLLPAFFAYAFQSRGVLVGRTAVFYLGLCATLVPLGMGISAVSSLVYGHRSTLITISGLIIIAFGVIQALGGGFAFGPIERLLSRRRLRFRGFLLGTHPRCCTHSRRDIRLCPAGRRPPRHVRRRHGRPSPHHGPPLGPPRSRTPPLAEGT